MPEVTATERPSVSASFLVYGLCSAPPCPPGLCNPPGLTLPLLSSLLLSAAAAAAAAALSPPAYHTVFSLSHCLTLSLSLSLSLSVCLSVCRTRCLSLVILPFCPCLSHAHSHSHSLSLSLSPQWLAEVHRNQGLLVQAVMAYRQSLQLASQLCLPSAQTASLLGLALLALGPCMVSVPVGRYTSSPSPSSSVRSHKQVHV